MALVVVDKLYCYHYYHRYKVDLMMIYMVSYGLVK